MRGCGHCSCRRAGLSNAAGATKQRAGAAAAATSVAIGAMASGRCPIPSPRRHPGSAQSSLVRGHRSAMPSREALILLAVIEHPWLLETHLEEFAEIEMIHPDTDQLRRAVLETASERDA